MAIRFPRMHIAESVVNRILNAADELHERAPVAIRSAPGAQAHPGPSVPDTLPESVQLDAKLSAPVGDLPPLGQAPDPGATVEGQPLLDTLLTPGQR